MEEEIPQKNKDYLGAAVNSLQGFYRGAIDSAVELTGSIEEKLRIAKESGVARRHSAQDLKSEESKVVVQLNCLEKLAENAEKSISVYQSVLSAKKKDCERMHEEYGQENSYPKTAALRDSISNRDLEIQITESIIQKYESLAEKLK